MRCRRSETRIGRSGARGGKREGEDEIGFQVRCVACERNAFFEVFYLQGKIRTTKGGENTCRQTRRPERNAGPSNQFPCSTSCVADVFFHEEIRGANGATVDRTLTRLKQLTSWRKRRRLIRDLVTASLTGTMPCALSLAVDAKKKLESSLQQTRRTRVARTRKSVKDSVAGAKERRIDQRSEQRDARDGETDR